MGGGQNAPPLPPPPHPEVKGETLWCEGQGSKQHMEVLPGRPAPNTIIVDPPPSPIIGPLER